MPCRRCSNQLCPKKTMFVVIWQNQFENIVVYVIYVWVSNRCNLFQVTPVSGFVPLLLCTIPDIWSDICDSWEFLFNFQTWSMLRRTVKKRCFRCRSKRDIRFMRLLDVAKQQYVCIDQSYCRLAWHYYPNPIPIAEIFWYLLIACFRS